MKRNLKQARRAGMVLVMTLVVIVLMTMTAAALLYRTTAEASATSAAARGEQAWAAAMSGIEYAMNVLAVGSETAINWQDNHDLFEKQFIASDGGTSWYFSIYAPDIEGLDEVRFGISDEAARMNLNTADESMLSALGLDAARIDCLLDWRDADDDARPDGAEQEYYAALQPIPYRTKNAPVITLEELLLVKGFDASVIYGEDANLNGVLDENENDGEETFPPDDGNGELDRGLAALATCLTYEPNISNDGSDRININGDERELGRLDDETDLPEQTVAFIRAYRDSGGKFAHPADLLEMELTLPVDDVPQGLSPSGRGPGRGRGGDDGESVAVTSGVGVRELPEVLDRLTTMPGGRDSKLPGLININTAHVKVLAAIDGIGDNIARQVVDVRDGLDVSQRQSIAWLASERLVDAETFRRIAPRLTARSFQYRVRSIGFGWPGGQFRVAEAVVDIADGPPRITYLRDITRLGLPVAIDMDEQTGAVTP